jgi:hypothetical protein
VGSSRTSEPDRKLEADDVPSQLEKLGELRESGVLTTEEFKAAKKRLLGRTRSEDRRVGPSGAPPTLTFRVPSN